MLSLGDFSLYWILFLLLYIIFKIEAKSLFYILAATFLLSDDYMKCEKNISVLASVMIIKRSIILNLYIGSYLMKN